MSISRFVRNSCNTKESKGAFGEMIVSSIFNNRYFGEEEHYLVNDIIFEYEGTTHQIDHTPL